MENIIEIRNLSKVYKNFTLDNISLKLQRGFIMGIIGENGAGKTTLINLIMNLVKRDCGTIEIFGLDNLKFERQVKDKIGFVYDQAYYYDQLTIEENGKIISKLYSKWDEDVFNKYLKKFSLNKKKKFKELSKGMRMKFSLCVALSHSAELIIMDEPTSGLDPIVRAEVLDELQKLMENENMGVIISTHITEDLEKIADYITFIKNGKVIFSKSKDEILYSYKIIKGSNDILKKDSEELFYGIYRNKYGFEGLTDNLEEVKNRLGDNLIIDKVTLEDVMMLYKS